MDTKRKQLAWRKQAYRHPGRAISQRSGIENGDRGILVTCERGREMKCVYELRDLLEEHISNTVSPPEADLEAVEDPTSGHSSGGEDLEASIAQELKNLEPSNQKAQSDIHFVKLDTPCVSFMRLAKHLDPVRIVHDICHDAHLNPERKRTRFVMRMTPMTRMKKILPSGLEDLCQEVLQPHFHNGGPVKKYAIRPTIRDNSSLDRDSIIELVGGAITMGEKHTVDLKNYDLLVLVDVYRNVCGMSVVEADYKELKGYNLTELYQPFPPRPPKRGKTLDDNVQKQEARDDNDEGRKL